MSDTSVSRIMDAAEMRRSVARIAHEIHEANPDVDRVVIVGIHTRGAHLADRLAELISEFSNERASVGHLEIGPHRDDTGLRPPGPPRATTVPLPIDNRSVVLVDDVLYTGRSARAAMSALAQMGRASDTQLAVLIDRGHRQLPIRPNYVGKNIPTSERERVSVRMVEEDGHDAVFLERVAGEVFT